MAGTIPAHSNGPEQSRMVAIREAFWKRLKKWFDVRQKTYTIPLSVYLTALVSLINPARALQTDDNPPSTGPGWPFGPGLPPFDGWPFVVLGVVICLVSVVSAPQIGGSHLWGALMAMCGLIYLDIMGLEAISNEVFWT